MLSKESKQKWEGCLEEAHLMASCCGQKVGPENYSVLPCPHSTLYSLLRPL